MESGKLEILQKDGTNFDTLVSRTLANKTGAERQVEFFEKQLADLSKASSAYSRLQDALLLEQEYLKSSQLAYQELDQKIDPEIETWGLTNLQRDYDWDQLQVLELKRKYQRAMNNYIDPVPAAYVVSKARPSYIKVYPNTMLNLSLGALGTLFFAVVIVSFYERLSLKK